MNVYKFGGASVKDATGVKNVATVLQKTNATNVLVVLSAMGKMTNTFEKVVTAYFENPSSIDSAVETIKRDHITIAEELFLQKNTPVFKQLEDTIEELLLFVRATKSQNHAFVYDQVVSYGELLSTIIVSAYLSTQNIVNTWLDVRSCIVTDNTYREAVVDWQATQQLIHQNIQTTGITVTQGFLGAEKTNNFTTTLGREGSDYTAAIFAYCLNAADVTIWKDVPGVLNADPRYFEMTTLLHHISYKEAIELAFYGASVIHPKTLQPLQRKEIPLFVKSFFNPLEAGTCVGKGVTLDPNVSCFILKKNQVLVSLSSLDFSFIVEKNISYIFTLLDRYKMKVALLQNSAISFSLVIDNKYNNLKALLAALRSTFKVSWNEDVTLYTIRHARPHEIKKLEQNKNVLVKQESRETVQLVIKE